MANHNTHTRALAYNAPLTGQGMAKRQGWNDVLDGKAPDRAYIDHEDKFISMAYERGRLFACNVKASGQRPMRWRTTTSTPVPLGTQLTRANQMVGRATPTL